jgi:hypothetical protein
MRIFSRPPIVLMFVILGVLPVLAFLASPDEWREWWMIRFYVPALERDLGFEARVGRHPAIEADILFITSVQPGGIFDRLGVFSDN